MPFVSAEKIDSYGRSCTKCGEYKAWAEYSYKRATGRKPGYQPRCKTCSLEDTRKWRESQSPERLKDLYLRRTYGISYAEYTQRLEEQDYCCAICSRELNTNFGMEALSPNTAVVDHCHTHGHVRGILCNECNRGLGYFKDNVNALAQAISYLTKDDQTLEKGVAHAIYHERKT